MVISDLTGEGLLDRSCAKRRRITWVKKDVSKIYESQTMMAKWVGHNLLF